MRLVAPTEPSRSRPLRILDGASEEGPRLGGRAPEGVFERLRDPAVYVMTLPLATDPELELSIFRQGELWDAMNAGVFSDDRVVAIVHAPSRRRADGRYRSALSEHRIVLGDEVDDIHFDEAADEPRPRSDHKLGGHPYCIQEPELDEGEALLRRGLVQLVQLDFPSSQDGDVSGSWPFADGMFNLFGAPPFEEWFWAFQK